MCGPGREPGGRGEGRGAEAELLDLAVLVLDCRVVGVVASIVEDDGRVPGAAAAVPEDVDAIVREEVEASRDLRAALEADAWVGSLNSGGLNVTSPL